MNHTVSKSRLFVALLFAAASALAVWLGSSPAQGAVGDPPYVSVNLGSAFGYPSTIASIAVNSGGEVADYDPNNVGANVVQVWCPTSSNVSTGSVMDLTPAITGLPVSTAPAATSGNAIQLNDSGEAAILVQDNETGSGAFTILSPSPSDGISYDATIIKKILVDASGEVSFQLNNYGELAVISDSDSPMTLETPTAPNGSVYRQALIGSDLPKVFTSSLNNYGQVVYTGGDSDLPDHLCLWTPNFIHGVSGVETDLTSSVPNGLEFIRAVQVNDFGQILMQYGDGSYTDELALWAPTQAHGTAGEWIMYGSYLPADTSIGWIQLNNYGQVLVNSIDMNGNDYATLITPVSPNSLSVKESESITDDDPSFSLSTGQLAEEGAVLLMGYDAASGVNEIALWAPAGQNTVGGMTYDVSSRVTPALPTNLITGSINASDTVVLSQPTYSEYYLVATRQ
jgi:hypothetical protein